MVKKRVFYPTNYDGYNKYFDICADKVDVMFGTEIDRVDVNKKEVIIGKEKYVGDIIVSTISPDILFDYQYGVLPYMGREFIKNNTTNRKSNSRTIFFYAFRE